MTVVALWRGLAGDSTYSAERLAGADNTTIDGKIKAPPPVGVHVVGCIEFSAPLLHRPAGAAAEDTNEFNDRSAVAGSSRQKGGVVAMIAMGAHHGHHIGQFRTLEASRPTSRWLLGGF
jgi:hypothetical protein